MHVEQNIRVGHNATRAHAARGPLRVAQFVQSQPLPATNRQQGVVTPMALRDPLGGGAGVPTLLGRIPRPSGRPWYSALACLGLLALCAAVWLLTATAARASGEGPVMHARYVTSGESLWSIAAACQGDDPVHERMTQIRDANDLDSVVLRVGQRLDVPAACVVSAP